MKKKIKASKSGKDRAPKKKAAASIKTRKTRSDKGVKRSKPSSNRTSDLPPRLGPLSYWVTEGCVLVTLRDGGTLSLPRDRVSEVVPLAEAGNEAAIRTLAKPKPMVSLFIQGDVPTQLWDVVQRVAGEDGDPTPLLNLWARLRVNPSPESRKDLYGFLTQHKIPVTDVGTFLAYKGVTSEFKDVHTQSIDNLPGTTVTMSREGVDSDRNSACSRGLHVGSVEYAASFSYKLLLVEVCPSDVVSVPSDSSGQKMRVCRYFVVKELDKNGKDATQDHTKVVKRSWVSTL